MEQIFPYDDAGIVTQNIKLSILFNNRCNAVNNRLLISYITRNSDTFSTQFLDLSLGLFKFFASTRRYSNGRPLVGKCLCKLTPQSG